MILRILEKGEKKEKAKVNFSLYIYIFLYGAINYVICSPYFRLLLLFQKYYITKTLVSKINNK